jgi:peptide/nickel transport system substrate-binding protein
MNRLIKASAAIAVAATMAAPGVFAQKQGGTMVMAIQSTPRHLNPAVQSGTATGIPGSQLFAAPLRYDEGWNPQPYLAESWKVSDDGLSVTLNLAKNAKFHDGHPITSEDIAFSVETVKAYHPFKSMFAPVTEVQTPDAHTAVLKLSKPHPALMLAMSSQLLSIIPKHIYGDGQDPKTHPRNTKDVVGSGPFKLTEFKRDQHIILERFDDFFIEGRPYLDKIVMRIIKDGAARTIALDTGEIQLSTFEVTPRNLARLKKNENIDVSSDGYAAIGSIVWLAFNTQRGNTADKMVRQAISYAVDRNFILKAIMLGSAAPAKTGIHPGSPFYDGTVNGYDVDLVKANKMLDDAGYKKGSNGMRFDLTVDYGWAAAKPFAEYLKPQLKKVGINVTVRASADFPSWAKRISTHDFDMTIDNVFNWGDPVIGVHRTYNSKNIKKGVIWSNTQQYSNARVDELMELAGSTYDMAERKKYYAEFQQILSDELPIYWLFAGPYHTVANKKLGNPPNTIWGGSAPFDRVYMK